MVYKYEGESRYLSRLLHAKKVENRLLQKKVKELTAEVERLKKKLDEKET